MFANKAKLQIWRLFEALLELQTRRFYIFRSDLKSVYDQKYGLSSRENVRNSFI